MKLLSYLQIEYKLARRKAVQLLQSGKVLLNNAEPENYQTELNIGDMLSVEFPHGREEKKIETFPVIDSQLILYHKPVGIVVSNDDPHNTTIYNRLPPGMREYQYIGRLDKDSSGLLLLANDKKLVHELGHPSAGIVKTYLVRIDSLLDEEQVEQCITGMIVDEQGQVAVAGQTPEMGHDFLKFESVEQEQRKGYVSLVIKLVEGHKRHIRRLLKACGKKVFALHRTAFGKYKLSDLKEGEWKVMDI